MTEKNTLKVKVNVAGRYYPMMVDDEKEVSVREASKLINEMIKDFEKNYSVADKQDALSMCALKLAAELHSIKEKHSNSVDQWTLSLQKINRELDIKL